jgi:PleD family two-component response regulator
VSRFGLRVSGFGGFRVRRGLEAAHVREVPETRSLKVKPSKSPKPEANPSIRIRPMILVAVDDLLFSSKIRATAKQAGVELAFARSPQEILDQARALKPPLVIFDLNSGKTDPINTIAALKSDPELAVIRTVGFVSHVDSSTIAAARNAGTDQVMPRSAFAAQLAEILLAGGSGRS